jgi:hypothetical protein
MNNQVTNTPTSPVRKGQITALTDLFALMVRASCPADEISGLAEQIGGALENAAEVTGVPFGEVDAEYRLRLKAGTVRVQSVAPPSA